MSLRIDIILHQKIVFAVTHFLSQIQIARLKSRFKHQSPIVRPLPFVNVLLSLISYQILCSHSKFISQRTFLKRTSIKNFSFFNQTFDIQKILMLKSFSLICAISAFIDYIRVTWKNNILNIVSMIVHFVLRFFFDKFFPVF